MSHCSPLRRFVLGLVLGDAWPTRVVAVALVFAVVATIEWLRW